MKIEARSVDETAKYCEVCQENFGNRFSFCPVCGELLKAAEAKPNLALAVVSRGDNSQVQSQKADTVMSTAPTVENAPELIGQPAVKNANEPENLQANQNSLDEQSKVIMKFVIPVKRSDNKRTGSQAPASEKPFTPSLIVAITISIAIVFGIALDLLVNKPSFLRVASSDNAQFAPILQTETAAKDEASAQTASEENSPQSVDTEIAPQSVVNIPPARQTIPHTISVGRAKKFDRSEELPFAALPLKVSVENVKTIRQQESSPMLPQKVFIPNPSANLIARGNLSEQSYRAPYEERTIKYGSLKRAGDKGFLNKVGSGLLYLPKMIFKRKRR